VIFLVAGVLQRNKLYVLEGVIKFSKLRSGCRYYVFDLAESCHAKIRESCVDDGIFYKERSPDLSFRLFFEDKVHAEEFETKVSRIRDTYRKRKPVECSQVATDIEVELEAIRWIDNEAPLLRIKVVNYGKIEEDSEGSPDFDSLSNSLVSAVEISDETRLRLLEREDSFQFFRQKPEKCHLISQAKFKEEKLNPNNIVFMSRFLHQQLDAIDSSEGIPQFYLTYISHSTSSHQGLVNSRPTPVYETVVGVIFKDELAKSTLSALFIRHTVVSLTEIRLVLYFPAPLEFRDFAQLNADKTIAVWKSYDGVE
jgi:hypothetical protein